MGVGSLRLAHQGASDAVQYDLLGSTWFIMWPWPEVKIWSWFFKVKESTRLDKRNTMVQKSTSYLSYPAPCRCSASNTPCRGASICPPSNPAPGQRREKRKKRYKARKKALRNYFGIFSPQVNINITTGHQSQNFLTLSKYMTWLHIVRIFSVAIRDTAQFKKHQKVLATLFR